MNTGSGSDRRTVSASPRPSRRCGVLLAPLASVLLVAGCGSPPATPEAQLEAWVAAMELAAEDKDRGAILDLVSPAYADARGNSRDDAGDLLRLYFLRQNQIHLVTSIGEIRVAGGTAAELEVTVAMAGTNDRALGFSADAYRFELELVASGNPASYEDWKLLAAKWGELGAALR